MAYLLQNQSVLCGRLTAAGRAVWRTGSCRACCVADRQNQGVLCGRLAAAGQQQGHDAQCWPEPGRVVWQTGSIRECCEADWQQQGRSRGIMCSTWTAAVLARPRASWQLPGPTAPPHGRCSSQPLAQMLAGVVRCASGGLPPGASATASEGCRCCCYCVLARSWGLGGGNLV